MTENELEKIAGISMENFRKRNHFSLKDELEKQPVVPDYRRAFYANWDYGEIFFVYDVKSE